MVEGVFIKPVQILKEKKFGKVVIAVRDDGLASIRISTNTEINILHYKTAVETLKEIGGGEKYPLLIVAAEYTLPSAEARAYIASAASNPYAAAEAYVITSLPQKLAGNIYLSFNQPARPTRMFNNELRAVEWLKTFL